MGRKSIEGMDSDEECTAESRMMLQCEHHPASLRAPHLSSNLCDVQGFILNWLFDASKSDAQNFATVSF